MATKLYLESINGEEEFYVLKFPLKLWRIVNSCQTSAIRWGSYGKTILIDYSQFQTQYLECPVPKFKTRNMNSFVRQLNMYGFKKLQTQQRNVMSRFCNIHEFFNENFRLGRPDLLCNVKRRTIPLKMEKMTFMRPKRQPRSEVCARIFGQTLTRNTDILRFWKSSSAAFCADGVKVMKPAYQMRLVPVFNMEIDEESETVVAEVAKGCDCLITSDTEAQLDESESEDEELTEDDVDPKAYEINFTQASPPRINLAVTEESNLPPDQPKIKEGFNGTHYILDVTGQLNFPLAMNEEGQSSETNFKNSNPIQLTSAEVKDSEDSDVMIHLPEPEDFYLSLANSFNNL